MQPVSSQVDGGRAAALASLCAHSWALRLLEILRQMDGARFVELAHLTGASRPRLGASLEALIEAGLIARNPGYGHPLRPEYILTDRGRGAADPAAECMRVARRWGDDADIVQRKWSLPLLHAIGSSERRFSALRASLPGVTPRAMSLGLAGLADAGLVRRDVVGTAPPSVLYAVARRARPVLPPLATLAGALATGG